MFFVIVVVVFRVQCLGSGFNTLAVTLVFVSNVLDLVSVW